LSGKGYFDINSKFTVAPTTPLIAGVVAHAFSFDNDKIDSYSSVVEEDVHEFGESGNDTCPDALWYHGSYDGSYPEPRDNSNVFDWNEGAVGFHIVSFSAKRLRAVSYVQDTTGGTKTFYPWVRHMIADGITATSGAVEEPGGGGETEGDIFFRYFLNGFNFAESMYSAQPKHPGEMVMIGDPLYRPFEDKNDSGQLKAFLDTTAPTITIDTDSDTSDTITVTGSYIALTGSADEYAMFRKNRSMARDYLFGFTYDTVDTRSLSPLIDEQFDSMSFELLFPALNGEEIYEIEAWDAYGNKSTASTAGLNIVWENNPPEFGDIWDDAETKTKSPGHTFFFAVDASDTDELFEYLEVGLEVTSVDATEPDSTTYKQMTLAEEAYNRSSGIMWIGGDDGGVDDKLQFEWQTDLYDTGTYEIWFYVRDGFDDYSDTYQKKKFTLVVE
jgi:hypothetical protein